MPKTEEWRADKDGTLHFGERLLYIGGHAQEIVDAHNAALRSQQGQHEKMTQYALKLDAWIDELQQRLEKAEAGLRSCRTRAWTMGERWKEIEDAIAL